MRIFTFSDRLVMILDVEDDFSFEAKAASDGGNAEVQQWERLMDTMQKELEDKEGKGGGWKWKRAVKCFDLSEHQ